MAVVVALVLWTMRRGMRESKGWSDAKDDDKASLSLAGFKKLFEPPHVRPLLFLAGMDPDRLPGRQRAAGAAVRPLERRQSLEQIQREQTGEGRFTRDAEEVRPG